MSITTIDRSRPSALGSLTELGLALLVYYQMHRAERIPPDAEQLIADICIVLRTRDEEAARGVLFEAIEYVEKAGFAQAMGCETASQIRRALDDARLTVAQEGAPIAPGTEQIR